VRSWRATAVAAVAAAVVALNVAGCAGDDGDVRTATEADPTTVEVACPAERPAVARTADEELAGWRRLAYLGAGANYTPSPSFEQLVAESDAIVVGRVVAVDAGRSKSGAPFAGPVVWGDYSIEVSQAIKGDVDCGDELVYEFMLGTHNAPQYTDAIEAAGRDPEQILRAIEQVNADAALQQQVTDAALASARATLPQGDAIWFLVDKGAYYRDFASMPLEERQALVGRYGLRYPDSLIADIGSTATMVATGGPAGTLTPALQSVGTDLAAIVEHLKIIAG
jgi:hypothetical protein